MRYLRVLLSLTKLTGPLDTVNVKLTGRLTHSIRPVDTLKMPIISLRTENGVVNSKTLKF